MRLIEIGDEVVVTYEAHARRRQPASATPRCCTFDGDQITEVEVYFGWNL